MFLCINFYRLANETEPEHSRSSLDHDHDTSYRGGNQKRKPESGRYTPITSSVPSSKQTSVQKQPNYQRSTISNNLHIQQPKVRQVTSDFKQIV